MIAIGKKSDIKFFRDADGKLQIMAPQGININDHDGWGRRNLKGTVKDAKAWAGFVGSNFLNANHQLQSDHR